MRVSVDTSIPDDRWVLTRLLAVFSMVLVSLNSGLRGQEVYINCGGPRLDAREARREGSSTSMRMSASWSMYWSRESWNSHPWLKELPHPGL